MWFNDRSICGRVTGAYVLLYHAAGRLFNFGQLMPVFFAVQIDSSATFDKTHELV